MRWSQLLVLVLVAMVSVLATGCTTRGPELGPVLQLNEDDGGAGSFSWAYYTSVVADGDEVAVAWMNQNGNKNRNVMVRHSSDRGQTWSQQQALNEPAYSNTISVVPTLHLLPGERELLALWQTRRNEAGQKFVLVRRSKDFGATWSDTVALNQRMQSFLPVYASRPDGRIVIAWTDERNVVLDVYANRSLDGGATWLENDVRVSKLPKSDAGAPALALGADDDAFLVWEERPRPRAAGGAPHLSFARSRDMGAKWGSTPRVDLGDEERPSPLWPQLVYAGGRLTLAWTGGVMGDERMSWLWVSQSEDDGQTWSEPIVAYQGETQPFFHLKTNGKQVYLVWHGGEGGKRGQIYWNASDDAGKTWRHPWTEPRRIDKGKGDAMHPRLALAADGDNLALTWQEGLVRVLASVSTDLGRTWKVDNALIMSEDEGNELRNPQIAVSSNAAYVVWERWPDKKKHIKTFADVDKVLPKDNFVRRVDIGR